MRVCTSVAAAVALFAVLAGCSSSGDGEREPASSDLTYLGDEVVDVEATLDEASALWRSTWRGWNQVITVPDDSRCWMLADESGEVAPHGLCGPFRGLGTRQPEWVLVSFVPSGSGAGTVRMAPGAIMPYDSEAGYNSKRLVGADGEEGSRDVEVPEPTGWPKVMPVGQSDAHPRIQGGRERLAQGRVRLLGHDYVLRIVTSRRAQFNDRSRYVPRRGGVFADVRFRHYDSDQAVEAGAALQQAARDGTLRVRIDYEDRTVRGALRIPEERGSGLRLKTYGPSAFFSLPTLEGARFVVSDGERTFTTTEDWDVVRSE